MYSGGVSSRFQPGFQRTNRDRKRKSHSGAGGGAGGGGGGASMPPGATTVNKYLKLEQHFEDLKYHELFGQHHTSKTTTNRLRINISGKIFETYEHQLNNYPSTLLGASSTRNKFYDHQRDEYFFDRNREAFEGILNFYQTNGKFEIPLFVPLDTFYEEMKFFGLVCYMDGESFVNDDNLLIIALKSQLNELNKQFETHKTLTLEEYKSRRKELKEKFKDLKFYIENDNDEDEDELNKKAPKNRLQRSLWLLLERPNRSLAGRIIAFICLLTVILSVTIMCLETLYDSNGNSKKSAGASYDSPEESVLSVNERRMEFFLLEIICNVIFTVEIVCRLIASPNKLQFMRSFPNILDIVAVLPFWMNFFINCFSTNEFKLIENTTTPVPTTTTGPLSPDQMTSTVSRVNVAVQQQKVHLQSRPQTTNILGMTTTISTKTRQPNQYGLSVLRILRLTRVLRVLKLSRHIRTLNIMGKILYECVYEIVLLLTFLAINIIIFSSLMYYIELHALGEKSPFISIPHSFWWAVISFTTIGYGDLLPHSDIGKLFGSFFILCGILIALLPVPILSCKFERIYKDLSKKHEHSD